jgi:hypothetical protein
LVGSEKHENNQFLLSITGPLTMFTPQLSRAKRKGLADYGLLANRYVEGFEQKWVLGNAAEADELLGTGDIQSLADLGNSYAAVKEMRPVPLRPARHRPARCGDGGATSAARPYGVFFRRVVDADL